MLKTIAGRLAIPWLALAAVAASSAGAPSGDFTIGNVGHIGGTARALAVDGGLAFVAQGAFLSVVDLDSADLEPVGFVPLPAQPIAVAAEGALVVAYLDQDAGLVVVDASDPTAPLLRGGCAVAGDWEGGVAVAGGHAFVASSSDGLVVVDIADPDRPAVVATVAGSARTVRVADGRAWVLDGIGGRLRVFDVSQPRTPTLLGSVQLVDPQDIAVAGTVAFLAEGRGASGLRLLDVSDPRSPTELAFLPVSAGDAGAPPARVAVAGSLVALAGGGLPDPTWLVVVDASQPTHPARLAELELDSGSAAPRALAARGSRVYLAASGSSLPLQEVDLVEPTAPVVRRLLEAPWDVRWLASAGSTLFAASAQRLWAYDVADPARPVLVASDPSLGGIGRLEAAGGLLVALRAGRLLTLDAGDPAAVLELGGVVPLSASPRSLAATEELAVVAGDDGLEVLTLADPGAPSSLSWLALAAPGRDLAVVGDLLLVAAGDGTVNRLEVVDLSTPVAPRLLASVPVRGLPMAVAADGEVAWVGSLEGEGWCLEWLDLSDPSAPRVVGSTSGDGELWDLRFHDDRLLAGVVGGSVHVFVWDPALEMWVEVTSCPSESTRQVSVSATGSKEGYATSGVYTVEGYGEAGSQEISGDDGVVVQVIVEIGDGCCLETSVAPDRAAAQGCSAKPTRVSGSCGQGVEVEATVCDGWGFQGWSGAASGSSLVTEAHMTGHCSVAVANFLPLLTLSAGPANPGPGWVCPPQTEADTVEVPVLEVRLTASLADDWQVLGFGVVLPGLEEAEELESASLRLGSGEGSLLATTDVTGEVLGFALQPSLFIPASSSVTLAVTLTVVPSPGGGCPEGVLRLEPYTNADLVNALAVNYPPGFIAPPAPPERAVSGGPIDLACVYDLTAATGYAAIQPAVDAAAPGSAILLCPVELADNVEVTKALSVQSVGGPATVEAADGGSSTFSVSAGEVTLSGLTITGATGFEQAGVRVSGGSVTVLDCRLEGNHHGLLADHGAGLTVVRGSTASRNSGDGIQARGDLAGRDVTASHNGQTGIDALGTIILNGEVVANDNGENGVDAGEVLYLDRVTASRNGLTGVGGKLVVVNTSAVAEGNGGCGVAGQGGIMATSLRAVGNQSWGVHDPWGGLACSQLEVRENGEGGVDVSDVTVLSGVDNVVSGNRGPGLLGDGVVVNRLECADNQGIGVGAGWLLLHGGAEVTGNRDAGLFARSSLAADNVQVVNTLGVGIESATGGVAGTDVEVRNSSGDGVRALANVTLKGPDTLIAGNEGHGVSGSLVVADRLECSGNGGRGLAADTVVVTAGGRVADNAETGVDALHGRVTVNGLVVSGNGGAGIEASPGGVSARAVVVSGNHDGGILADGAVSLAGLGNHVVDNPSGPGVSAFGPVTLVDAVISRNGGPGVDAHQGVSATVLRATDNQGHGLKCVGPVSASTLTVDRNQGDGVNCLGNVTLSNGRVCGNTGNGVAATGSVALHNVEVCGNGGAGVLRPGGGGSSSPAEGGIAVSASQTGLVTASSLSGNEGDGLRVEEGGASVALDHCNVLDNAGLGANDLSSSATITARDVWWGDPSGPGGSGPGSGDEVSAGVELDGWRAASVGVVVAVEVDRLDLASGQSATNTMHLRSWAEPDGGLGLEVVDPNGWVASPPAAVQLDGSSAELALAVAVPAGTPAGTVDLVTVSVVSTTDPADRASVAFEVVAGGDLARLEVEPADATVTLGETLELRVVGADGSGHTFPVVAEWSTDGGVTDDGLFLATEAGDFTVMARVGDVVGSATVRVVPPDVARVEVSPARVVLAPGEQTSFTATVFDSAGAAVAARPRWRSEDGAVSDQGVLHAPLVEGDFSVTAAVPGAAVVGQARVHVGLDGDGDGVRDAVESAAPNGGDGNADGLPDREQATVASLAWGLGSSWLTVAASCPLTRADLFEPSARGGDQGWSYPLGLLELELACPSASVTVLLHRARDLGPSQLRAATGGQGFAPLPEVEVATLAVGPWVAAAASFVAVDGGAGDAGGVDGTILVRVGPALPTSLTVPVVAHLEGVGGTPWRSDVAVTNPSPWPLAVELCLAPEGLQELVRRQTLPAWGTVLLEDLVEGTFAAGEVRGPLTVAPVGPGPRPAILSRTVAERSFGRFGQSVPASAPLPPGEYLVTGLREDSAYRSNLAVTAAERDVTVAVELLRGVDGVVGVVEQHVPARAQVQWSLASLFPGLARAGVPMAVRVATSAPAIPYASLVDNLSTDAVTLVAAAPGREWVVPVVAHNPGQQGTSWRSDLALVNPGVETVTVLLEYLPEGVDNGAGGPVAEVVLAPEEVAVAADVAGDRFGVTDGKGALRVTASAPVVVASRVYTGRGDGSTTGHGVAAVPLAAYATPPQALAGVRTAGGYRSNLGLVAAEGPVAVTVTLRDGDGGVLATATVEVPARSLRQLGVQGLFPGAPPLSPAGSLSLSASGPVLGYLSVVDPSSQDPVYDLPQGLARPSSGDRANRWRDAGVRSAPPVPGDRAREPTRRGRGHACEGHPPQGSPRSRPPSTARPRPRAGRGGLT